MQPEARGAQPSLATGDRAPRSSGSAIGAGQRWVAVRAHGGRAARTGHPESLMALAAAGLPPPSPPGARAEEMALPGD